MIKIFVSPCLIGEKVRYDGKIKAVHPTLERWQQEGRVISLCPEVSGGLTVPRIPAEVQSKTPLVVKNNQSQDVTQSFLDGANKALTLCQKHHIRLAVLKSKSPSCGIGKMYDGDFSGRLVNGDGVTAALFRENGIRLYTEEQIEQLEKDLALIESICVVGTDAKAADLADFLDVARVISDESKNYQLCFEFTDKGLECRSQTPNAKGKVRFDFLAGKLKYRQGQISQKNEPLLRAIGFGKGARPKVLDCTAGMGRESFLMASAGCTVHSLERNPFIHALLADAYNRCIEQIDLDWTLENRCSLSYLGEPTKRYDVIYLDPMYPAKEGKGKTGKSAVKVEMRLFKALAGEDLDEKQLFDLACCRAIKRVVVKRPEHAPALESKLQQTSIDMKKHRFDVYHIS